MVLMQIVKKSYFANYDIKEEDWFEDGEPLIHENTMGRLIYLLVVHHVKLS